MGAGESSTVHCDESSVESFHFSAFLFLQDAGFECGELVFYEREAGTGGGGGDGPHGGGDGPHAGSDRPPLVPKLRLRVEQRAGRLAAFSSGWENIHSVAPVVGGERWSLPVFWSFRDNRSSAADFGR